MADPRVYFAAERTTLAWIRTGIAMMGLGFVVARFGLFMRYVAHSSTLPTERSFSLTIGILLVILGSVTCVVAGMQFWWLVRRTPADQLPSQHAVHLASLASVALGVLGTLLVIHLSRT